MLRQISIPEPQPAIKVMGYKMPESKENLLAWDFVTEQMRRSRHYWISTVYPDQRPHVVPVWGIWHENRFFFEGSLETAWGKNILNNRRITVHLPSADQVVIIEGLTHIIQDDELDDATWKMLDYSFQSKYQVEKGSPYLCIDPGKVIAWDGEELTTMTRWLFDQF